METESRRKRRGKSSLPVDAQVTERERESTVRLAGYDCRERKEKTRP